MFTGDYGFFDYKYNIPGYTGQDYGGTAQYVYLAISAVLLAAFLVALRRTPRDKVRKIVGFIGIFLTVMYIAKTSWESYYDIGQTGAFNTGLLPLDTCSLIMPAGIIAGFGKGKIQRAAWCWVATGSVVGGFATMLFLNAFYYYPFFSFGATYSMVWHFLMVFSGLLILVTERPPLRFPIVLNGFAFHLAASLAVIPVDFIFDFDFMMYRRMGSVPFFEGVGAKLEEAGIVFLNPVIMLILYFAAFSLIWLIAAGIKNGRKDHPIREQ
ncbi:MAG: YwaF family protein [Clostridia bacterium]|nr:YwaF family protein [Clostridia bacterium]